MKPVLIGLLKAYRLLISPLYGNTCRYWPTCSSYALGAVEHHGAVRGTWLTVRRLGRCHPWASGGYDPVPGTPEAERWAAEQESARVDTRLPNERPHSVLCGQQD
ncbi:MAG: membrane protein insertion efficiency factor YidD [Propionibacteriales bacterium]|nr:membrane protein insertion efficiency factor YidD [Propionibacteriales bacterium]